MMETAKYLSIHISKACVVITGSIRHERFSNSDALTNLGFLIASAYLIERGVFIAMNGIFCSCNIEQIPLVFLLVDLD
jgi:L-asparaginase/Glu-tRNA(Gln) amidotransferase subunit D